MHVTSCLIWMRTCAVTILEGAVEDWLAKFVTTDVSMPTGRLLMTLNEAIAEGFSYKRRASPGTQTPNETLASQQGTCRDFALLMMEAARSLGFAARFVTGYVYVPDRDGPQRLGGGSTHAWCQIYVPGSGWIEFDPTNGIVGNRDLIRVGVARTPEQAIPLSGSYWGDSEDELGMDVTVNVTTEGGAAKSFGQHRQWLRCSNRCLVSRHPIGRAK